MTRSNRRTNQSGADLVTPRPQVGRAYTSHTEHTTVTSPNRSGSAPEPWCCCNIRCFQNCLMCKGEEEEDLGIPGGRALWVRMISWLMVVEILGCVCLFLGSTFLTNSFLNDDDNDKTAAAISACLLVAGAILMGGGIILGRLFISNKWRKTTHRAEEGRNQRDQSDVGGSNQRSTSSNNDVSLHPLGARNNETSFITIQPLASLPSYDEVLADSSHPSDFNIIPSSTTSQETEPSGRPGDSTPTLNSHEVQSNLTFFQLGREDHFPPPYTVTLQESGQYGPPSTLSPDVEFEPPPPYQQS